MQNWDPARLTDEDIAELTAFRHALHRQPELSREERATAQRIRTALLPLAPDQILMDMGGHGVAAVWDSGLPGPVVLFRSETDALPIQELGEIAHRSEIPGKAHLCGHDGHSTILLGLARLVARNRPARGRVVLMFQPAEEDGSGAAAVIADPRYASLQPDWAFSLHNMPGFALAEGFVSEGPANCASRGICIQLQGSTAHAAMPENGRSPMRAVSALMPALTECGQGGPLVPGYALVTVTHCRMGEPVYGVAPGFAEIRATLRCVDDAGMEDLCRRIETLCRDTAAAWDLECALDYDDIFLACTNEPAAVEHLRAGMQRAGVVHHPKPSPQRGSEDFGRFGHAARSAMVVFGAGLDSPAVHTPRYDFPDALIAPGAHLFFQTLGSVLEAAQ